MDARSSPSVSTSSTYSVISLVLGFSTLWIIFTHLYRLFWSPVAKIPGPRLAGLSFWYEFYYDIIKPGQYTFKLKSLHEKYGPIIRINPYEVHIDDPEFYDQVYVGASTRKTDKWGWSVNMFAILGSVITTVPHDLHRRRRAMIANHFSTTTIHRLQPLLRSKVNKLLERIDQAAQAKELICLTHAYSALTIDIITAYTFAKSRNYLDSPDFSPGFVKLIARLSRTSHVSKQMPWLIKLAQSLPNRVALWITPEQAHLIDLEDGFREQVKEAKALKRMAEESGEKAESGKVTDAVNSIFDSMLDAQVPESEKSTLRLGIEAQVLVIAGTLTTAHALEVITFNVLSNPAILSRLQEELASTKAAYLAKNPSENAVNIKDLPLQTLESCDYLTAVIREGLRMSYGVAHRLQRVSPDTTLHYNGYDLPPGTPVSMSAKLMHDNEDIFPDAQRYKPERWLPMDQVGNKLYRYLVPFSKGTRNCLGMNLAWAELYLTVPAVLGGAREFQLYDTTWERDIKTTIDVFNPLPSDESQGLRVLVSKSA